MQAFLGLLNFYHSFLKNKATVVEPLHRLLDSSQTWSWSKHHDTAFKQAKALLTSNSLLVHFDVKKPIVLVCDASPYGIGAVLCHRLENGKEAPVAYYSRTLSKTERNYAQIDREALAVIAAVKRFHHFLYGLNFEIFSDHKPLLGLFSSEKPTPDILSPRMLRWSVLLSAYNYKLHYRPGKSISNADGLSRCPVPCDPPEIPPLHDVLLLEMGGRGPISSNTIAIETSRDKTLSRILNWALRGWPTGSIPSDLQPFRTCQNSISVYRGCLLRDSRVIIPTKLRKTILDELHTGHPGMVRMKALARSYVWWPGIQNEIESYVKLCSPCQSYHRSEAREEPIAWGKPRQPWLRLHLDFAGPFLGKLLLIVIDAYSKWLHVEITPNMTSDAVISVLRKLFAIHGIPECIISDKGRCFDSETFKQFCTSNAITHKFSAPFHPSSNGQAERLVQSTKLALKKMLSSYDRFSSSHWELDLARYLLHQHVTPSATEGLSPAELLMGRALRTTLDALRPDKDTHRSLQTDCTSTPEVPSPTRSFQNGERVYARNFGSGPDWIPAIVSSQEGPVTYTVESESRGCFSRHTDQLRSRISESNHESATDVPEVIPTSDTQVSQQLSDLIPEHLPQVIPESSLQQSSAIEPNTSNSLLENTPVLESIVDQPHVSDTTPTPPPRLRRNSKRSINHNLSEESSFDDSLSDPDYMPSKYFQKKCRNTST